MNKDDFPESDYKKAMDYFKENKVVPIDDYHEQAAKVQKSGRKKGFIPVYHKIFMQMGQDCSEQLIKTVIDMALNDRNVFCIKILIDRLWPIRKGAPFRLDMPPLDTIEDLQVAYKFILAKQSEGVISAEEAYDYLRNLTMLAELMAVNEFKGRLDTLETTIQRHTFLSNGITDVPDDQS